MNNILFVESPDTTGGSHIILHSILKNLDYKRFNAILVTNSLNKQKCVLHTDKIPNVIYIEIPIPLPWTYGKIFKYIQKNIPNALKLCGFLYWYCWRVFYDVIRYVHLILKYKIDIVHSNNGISYSLALPLACAITKAKFISHLRGACAFPIGDLFKIAHRFPSYYIAVSHHIKQTCRGIVNDYSNRVRVIWDGIEGESIARCTDVEYIKKEFNIGEQHRIIGFVGRIVDWKGVEEFISASAIICKEHPNTLGFIVGGYDSADPYYHSLCEKVTELDLNNKLIFTGYRTDIPYFLNLFEIVFHCSVIPEPLGTVILEAMACSKPVVAYNLGGAAEMVVSMKTGILVPFKEYRMLGEAGALLLGDPQLASSYGKQGFQRYQTFFTGMASTRQIEEVYDTILTDDVSC